MPQLNPSPWLMVLLLSWLVFLVVLPPKITAHSLPNEAASQAMHKPEANSWTWLWP